jgi:HK97 family phage portal protein
VGLLNAFRLAPTIDAPKIDVTAASGAYFPVSLQTVGQNASPSYVDRNQAMTVPAVARARNIIAGTISTLPMKSYIDSSGIEIEGRTLVEQPDPALPRQITMAWTIDDLIFYGVAYWEVLSLSPVDGRPDRARRIDPTRVTYFTDPMSQTITGYSVDGKQRPLSGTSSLIVFWSFEEGVLSRASRTIRAAIELEAAALRMAQEPVPQMILKNEGMNLPEQQKEALLSAFRTARANRSTAYVEGAITLDVVGFDAAQLQLVEARQHVATEISRVMGIPAWYLNAESASATYSNVSSERRSLLDFSLRNFLHIVESRLSMDDLTPRGQQVEYELDDYLRGNSAERVDIITKLLTAGVITVDEARAMEDLAPTGVPIENA